jgi:hypothetical protein
VSDVVKTWRPSALRWSQPVTQGQATQGPTKTSAVQVTRRQKDGARFIEAFYALTGISVPSASPEALPVSFLDQTVPSPTEILRRFGSTLELRTSNSLRRHVAGIVEHGRWTHRRLLDIRGLGLFGLIDILRALADGEARRSSLSNPSSRW